MKEIVLVGAGGHCKVIIDIIKSTNEYKIIGALDKVGRGNVVDVPIIGDDSLLTDLYNDGVRNAFVCVGALGNLNIRNVIFNELKGLGYELPVLIHKTAVVSSYSNIGEGTCVMAGAVVNSCCNIGQNCIVNTGVIIEHDCRVGRNVHLSPGSIVAGGVSIGDNSHIGLGSKIIETVKIGSNATVGAGAVVINNIEDDVLVLGIPARVVKEKNK